MLCASGSPLYLTDGSPSLRWTLGHPNPGDLLTDRRCLGVSSIARLEMRSIATLAAVTPPTDIETEFLFTLTASVGAPFDVGELAQGRRRISPIEGGEFEARGCADGCYPSPATGCSSVLTA